MQSTYMRARRNKKRKSFEFRWSFHDNHSGSPCIHPSFLFPVDSLFCLMLLSPFFSLFYETTSQGPGGGWEHSLPCETPRTLQLVERKSGKKEMRDMNSWVGCSFVPPYLIFCYSGVIINKQINLSCLNHHIKCSRDTENIGYSPPNNQLSGSLSKEERMAIESSRIRNIFVTSKRNVYFERWIEINRSLTISAVSMKQESFDLRIIWNKLAKNKFE